MNLLEIIMLILGILIIILSCRIVGKPDKNNGASSGASDVMDKLLQEELNSFKEQQSDILNSVSEEVLVRADDYLSKLSNEKIMAVSEYSDQILEKITRNHEEVVFLYNMLNQKEKELKETVRVSDSFQRKAEESINKSPKDKASDDYVPDDEVVNSRQLDTQAMNIKLETMGRNSMEQVNNNQSTLSINNAEILKLHEQGKTILDIAKQLGIGQGEVKLVIDLFEDR